MKHMAKRGLSFLLVVALCVSLLSGLVFAETSAKVNYVTGDATGFRNVIKNWGQRGQTASFLSPNAQAFYADNDTTYASLASMDSKTLYSALKSLMASNHKVITSYGDTRDLYRFTDCQNSDSSSISSFYSGVRIGPKWDSGATWNREHTWPNSKGLNGSDEDDIMMLRPTSSSENSARGNKAYGQSSGYYDPNDLSNGEYDLHGDVARIVLYVHVRWGNQKLYGTSGVIESREVLLKWMKEDPVDTWEMGRNDSVESITGTRNVFVDYPELAYVMLDSAIPSDMITPSGEAYGGSGITANVNDSSLGRVVVSGNTITAFPAEGVEVTGYTVVSGNATVTRNGNVFVVSSSSSCTIRINFAAKSGFSVKFMENGTSVGSKTAYDGDVITLPNHSSKIPDGYSFEGWVESKLNETSAAPKSVYRAGDSYTVKKAVTLYALYSRVDQNSAGQSSVYNAYTGTPVEGDYLIVSDNGALTASITNKRFDVTSVSANGDAIANPDADQIWHIAPAGNGTFTIYNKKTASYAGGTGVKSQGGLLSSVTDYAKWTISASHVFENLGNKTKGVNHTLRRNADFGFACYAASTGTGLSLYKLAAGTVFYTTSTDGGCQHSNTSKVSAQNATCTAGGFTAGVYCKDCKTYISGHESISAAGHKYVSVVTPPTEKAQGYTTYTCSVCRDQYVSDYTDALKGNYKVSFVVPVGVEAVTAMDCGSKGIKLPSAAVPAGDYVYTFVGWSTASVDNVEAKPNFLKSGSTFTTDSNVTLYALYSYTNGKIYYTTVLSCQHNGSFVAAVPADCKTDGSIAHYVCDSCGLFFADSDFTQKLENIVVPKLDHTFGAYEADDNGHWKTCACGAKDEEGEHDFCNWFVTDKAAVGKDGKQERICYICDHKQIEIIPAEEAPATNIAVYIVVVVVILAIAGGVVVFFVVRKRKTK